MSALWDGFLLWLHKTWGWLVGWAGAATLNEVKEGLGITLTCVLIVVGVFNAIKSWKEIRKK